ncbi:D-alanyl-D-alanine carboxypeptidase family protein [Agromyces kandeliae]|uniref:D-alanyl-D-alanine carboxypeptidase n=1 Tax=Agromyces kandeliae TaxID=2666141 RepID=A0A6L5R4B9_9MICO|nr:D-alanyl-D-alanine carboxypeptidase [Agromyces kandeliae]MRX44863.1 D-alanyl-D-alanine carboxypeptidase [Agromyces kandeliae]
MSRTLDPAPPTPTRPPKPSAAVYRRRRIVAVAVLAVLLGLFIGGGMYTSSALGAPVPAAEPAIADPAPIAAQAQEVAQPGFGTWAVGAVGFDGLMAAGGEDTPMPMASIAKVITALVVLEEHPIPAGEGGPQIAYTDADVDIYWDMVAQNGSVAPVVAGSELSLKESLEAMMLPSGNNYSISLANWAFGSVDGYLERASAWLSGHGLTETRVVDTSGLSLDDVSTAADLVRLGEIALENPTLAQIVATRSVAIPELGTIENSNRLLGTHGIDGIKTGTTDDAANLLFSADVAVGESSVTLVGVVLGGDTHALVRGAVAGLVDSIGPGFHEVVALEAGRPLAAYATPWGDTAEAVTTEGATVVVWSDTPVDIAVEAGPLRLVDDGAEVGVATVTAGTQVIEVPLAVDGALEDPGAWWRLSNPGALDEGAVAEPPAG